MLLGGGSDRDNKWVGAAANASPLCGLALPYLKDLDHRRVSQILTALQSLQLMEQEGVIMTMPIAMTFK